MDERARGRKYKNAIKKHVLPVPPVEPVSPVDPVTPVSPVPPVGPGSENFMIIQIHIKHVWPHASTLHGHPIFVGIK